MSTIIIAVTATLAVTSTIAVLVLIRRRRHKELCWAVLGTAAAIVGLPAVLFALPSNGWDDWPLIAIVFQFTVFVGSIHLLLFQALLLALASKRRQPVRVVPDRRLSSQSTLECCDQAASGPLESRIRTQELK